ncbi:DUF2075 domain-containing protein [Rubinisphaera margarita]|uniref:DUF2075 domain-containing protein n=1 Tax=Rubinisphaera margarita TaxID=2909586 RepID=UPI001EE94115|nr:DUF2075 domain-containing protein [Rubinisphaera margarita]MCG6157729.1 DUF2075 domain-containing protein [Rubinisphaera margarita]
MQRYFYADSIASFLATDLDGIVGQLARLNAFSLDLTQRDAWIAQIELLKDLLSELSLPGEIFFEYSIPRLGRRIDVVLLIDDVVFVIEFKVGEASFPAHAIDQVWDYALDLKNFHEASHDLTIAPILVATQAPLETPCPATSPRDDGVLIPLRCNCDTLAPAIRGVLQSFARGDLINDWKTGRYSPTPTIIEAAQALYSGHNVAEISRSDGELERTTDILEAVIEDARLNNRKCICFVTGVPGAGKTLVGLNIATKHINHEEKLHSVFLSGNGPLVSVLREALTRDQLRRDREAGKKTIKEQIRSRVKMFIQNVHHFRDDCLVDRSRPPIEHVAIFDEAQRAWNLDRTANFMRQRKNVPGFDQSEPEFLISCLDRHEDWAVIICLVGGGQEINLGEAGIQEWVDAIIRSYPDWHAYVSPRLTDSEYSSGMAVKQLRERGKCILTEELHLTVAMRSFRAEQLSAFVKNLLDLELREARQLYASFQDRYPMALTRDIQLAKEWIREHARGGERYGVLASSSAQRLKPYAIDVRVKVDPVHWFLNPKDDVRSSFYMEDVATEFQVQGLELDWACVTWDADLRKGDDSWTHFSFRGRRWTRVRKTENQRYLKNAYRVLLTRARQGMVIVVPPGDPSDPTRRAEYYDRTYEYLADTGLPIL